MYPSRIQQVEKQNNFEQSLASTRPFEYGKACPFKAKSGGEAGGFLGGI